MANKKSTFTPAACLMPIVMEIRDVVLEVNGSGGNYQEKTVIPSQEEQIVTPDANYAALSKVTVGAIPSDYGKITYQGDTISVT